MIDYSGLIEIGKASLLVVMIMLWLMAIIGIGMLLVAFGEYVLSRAWKLKEDYDEFRTDPERG